MSKDGITTQELVLEKLEGIFEPLQVDMKGDTSHQAIHKACGILKNLDDYQYILCLEVRSIADSNPYKMILQKYRVTIVSAFAKFVVLVRSNMTAVLQDWSLNAQLLLEGISDTLPKARLNMDIKQINEPPDMMFDYFDMPKREVDDLLESIY